MKISSILTETYVPESTGKKVSGNRALPVSDQISVELKFPTQEEFDRYGGDSTAITKLFVTGIKNLVVGEKTIADGKELVACPRRDIVYLAKELYLHLVIESTIDEKTEKN